MVNNPVLAVVYSYIVKELAIAHRHEYRLYYPVVLKYYNCFFSAKILFIITSLHLESSAQRLNSDILKILTLEDLVTSRSAESFAVFERFLNTIPLLSSIQPSCLLNIKSVQIWFRVR